MPIHSLHTAEHQWSGPESTSETDDSLVRNGYRSMHRTMQGALLSMKQDRRYGILGTQ